MMSPRIRSFFARPPYAREAKSPAREAPSVFREFVETLQSLDPPGRAAERGSAAISKSRMAPASRSYRARRRRNLGNGHAHPHANRRRRPR